eukprot:EG_transcript_31852
MHCCGCSSGVKRREDARERLVESLQVGGGLQAAKDAEGLRGGQAGFGVGLQQPGVEVHEQAAVGVGYLTADALHRSGFGGEGGAPMLAVVAQQLQRDQLA